ncbi:MAG: ferredoxin family protein [Elusimicrobiota bacterium]|jgi:2-oxoglutarate ferredoxin oxidoreductase subunit delta|nr:ferredoxin family protein [Elusimicrobiota bacterium]
MPTIKINSNKCKGCGLCINACPQKILSFSKEFNKKGYHWAVPEKTEACIGCGFCYQVCPDVCIEVYK